MHVPPLANPIRQHGETTAASADPAPTSPLVPTPTPTTTRTRTTTIRTMPATATRKYYRTTTTTTATPGPTPIQSPTGTVLETSEFQGIQGPTRKGLESRVPIRL